MAHGTCSLEGCGKRGVVKRGWCTKHYQRWLNHGDPLWEPPGRAGEYDSSGHYLHAKICPQCGGTFMLRADQTHCSAKCANSRPRPQLDVARERNPNWLGEDVGYSGLHIRLRRVRGRASQFECADCGMRAEQWSYDHRDPDELASEWGSYSTDLSHYVPRCTPCHKIFDLEPFRDRPGWERPKRGRRVLNAELVRDIRSEVSAGVSASELADRYGLKMGTLQNVLVGRTWGWVV